MKLPYAEVKFYPEVKSQTGLSSLQLSWKRAHIIIFPKFNFDLKPSWKLQV